MIETRQVKNEQQWNKIVDQLNGHPLQLWGWGTVKEKHGWSVDRAAVYANDKPVCAAQILIKNLPKPFKNYAYIPRGPVGSHKLEYLNELTDWVTERHKIMTISAEPDTVNEKLWPGWRSSANRILLARTAALELTKHEDELLSAMSKKTRQYIRKSSKEGITVRQAENRGDVENCLKIYKDTAKRANFALHSDSYYYDIKDALGEDSPIYMAEYQGKVVAFLWPIVTKEVAFELYGGMNELGQNLRANYHLKWTVIQTLKSQGIQRYDVNGLLNDGVTAFKQGFIPEETHMSGTFDYPVDRIQYMIWINGLPFVKRTVQRLRRR